LPIFTALDTDPALLDAHERNFVANIREHGWFTTHVGAEQGKPAFSYTTGFWLRFEFPELIVFGLQSRVAHDTYWHMYQELQAGKRFGIGIREGDIFQNLPAVLLPVAPQYYREHLGWSRWFYGNDDFLCLQLIFPEISAQFPWESSSEGFRAVQPDLTAGGWSGRLRH